MSKFFTSPLGLLLASFLPVLGSESVSETLPTDPLPTAVAAPAGLPSPLQAGRFLVLGKKSPFTLASASQENADFAKDLMLAGYVRIDGQDFVMIASRSRPERILVGTKPAPAAQGMVLLKIERDSSGDPSKLQARVRKGTEEATLKYESVSSAPTPAANPGQAPVAAPSPVAGQPALPGQTQAAPPAGQPSQRSQPLVRRRINPIPAR